MGAEVPALTMGFDRARTPEEAARRIVEELTTPVVTRTGAIGPDRLTAEDAVFDEVRLRKEIARAMQYHQMKSDAFPAIRDIVHQAGELQRIDDPSDALRAHWTTQRQLATERFVLDALRQRSRTGGHGIAAKRVEEAMARSRVPLDDEQRAAIAAMTDHRGLLLLSAEAGTGKGEAVAAVVADAYRSAGYRVVAVAVSAERSVKFGQQVRADRACSIDSLTQPGSKIGPRDLIIVDEAGQVDTVGRWDRLLRHVGSAKVLPIGDERQLSAVTPGGIFEEAQKRVPTVKLTKVYRNRDENVVAVWRTIREGRGREAAKTMLELRMLDFAEDRRQLRDRLVDHWEAMRRRGEFALLTDTSNREVDLVNAMIQARRRSRYELGTAGVPVGSRTRRSATTSARRPSTAATSSRRRTPSGSTSSGG